MKKFIDRISIDSAKFEALLERMNMKATPLFNSLYWSKNWHYLLDQMRSWEKVVSINKYKEFQWKFQEKYGFVPNLIQISQK